jgi:hypothetical protein
VKLISSITEAFEELKDLYSSNNINRVIESTKIKWERHVARMGKRRVLSRILVGKPQGK